MKNQGSRGIGQDTTMKSSLVCGSFLCINGLYWRSFGGGYSGYGPVGAGADAGGHLGGGPRIRSSSGGQDEAIDTPTIVPGVLVRPLHGSLTVLLLISDHAI